MPMLDVQRRHAEVFRLRMGEKDGSGNPKKLTDAIRVTSPSRAVVDAFTDVYGGETKPWEGQWEAKLPTTELPIMVLPGQSISQWWELYKGAVCERRCDGETETLSGQPCMCPSDLAVRMAAKGACRPMTRLSLLCPDVDVVGAGSLVTHGMVAAETLPQAVAVAEAALSRGLMVPGVLRVMLHKGKNKQYVVPQIEIVGVSLTALTTGEVPQRVAIAAAPQRAIAAPATAELEPPKATAVKKAAKKAAAAPRREPPPLPSELPSADEQKANVAKAKQVVADALTPAQARLQAAIDSIGPVSQRGELAREWKAAGYPPLKELSDDEVPLVESLIAELRKEWDKPKDTEAKSPVQKVKEYLADDPTRPFVEPEQPTLDGNDAA